MSHDHGVLIAQFRETLTQQRYSPVVVHNYCRNADHFLRYLAEREIDVEAATPAKPAIPVTTGSVDSHPSPSASFCESFRETIELGLRQGRNAMGIWQDLVSQAGFQCGYQTVKRVVRKLRGSHTPEAYAVIVTGPGEEGQKIEYRQIKPYWTKRFRKVSVPFELRLLNGMNPPVPEVTVLIHKVTKDRRAGEYQLQEKLPPFTIPNV